MQSVPRRVDSQSMDADCLNHRLTDEERRSFDERGYFIARDVLPPETLARVTEAADRLYVQYRPKYGLSRYERLNHLDCIGFDEAFLELLDWPRTIAKVIDILGWHIQLYHSHLIITPPPSPDQPPQTGRLGWHQDSGRLNIDLETDPRPRVSLKVAFVLTDIETPDRGSTHVIPGSHRRNTMEFPADNAEHPGRDTRECPRWRCGFFRPPPVARIWPKRIELHSQDTVPGLQLSLAAPARRHDRGPLSRRRGPDSSPVARCESHRRVRVYVAE